VKYSFKTGKQTGVLFDVKNTRGAKVEKIEGYVMSPTEKHILIQTGTKPVYRH
jgi:dipeptidyl-peptidase-4